MAKYNISIDCGLSMGVAVWDAEYWGKEPKRPVFTYYKENWNIADNVFTRLVKNGDELAKALFSSRSILTDNDTFNICVIEYPEVYDTSKSYAAAAKGDLIKLAVSCGYLLGFCSEYLQCNEFYQVTPKAWKGQMPKPVVNFRIMQIIGCDESEYVSHEWDSIGLGLWQQGFFDDPNSQKGN